MSETAEFDLGDVLSVTGERLVSPDGMSGVYRICNWLAGESLYTHQLIRAHHVFKPELLRQHPELAEIDDSQVTSENWRTWLKEQKARYGDTLTIAKPPAGLWEHQHPLEELRQMVGPEKPIIALHADNRQN